MRRFGLFLITALLQVMCTFVPCTGYATTAKPTINILAWWGYLDDPDLIARTEKACNVKISHDDYYSNDEFLRRWSQYSDSYDLIIFSNTIYKIVEKNITPINNSQLSALSTEYNPIIRKHYQQAHYPHNIAYFSHALTGIFYNPKNIQVSTNDSYETLFDKSNGAIVVLLDDAIEINNFFNIATSTHNLHSPEEFNETTFKRMCKNSDIYIANNSSSIFNDKKFNFAFYWSGEAISQATKHPDFKFIILPDLSYISTDLIAQTSNNKPAECVALEFSKKETLNKINDANFYFSPYANSTTANKSSYSAMYNIFIKSLSNVTWINPPNLKEFSFINQQWEKIKLSLLNKNQQNWSSQ